MLSFWLALSASVGLAYGQVSNSFPHSYPGKPSGDFSPAWQSCTYSSLFRCPALVSRSVGNADFQVTEKLPNISFPLNRNWAGNIPVDRTGHPNDTLFFWAWEWQNGSLTAAAGENQDQPWGIWLNGGYASLSPPDLMDSTSP